MKSFRQHSIVAVFLMLAIGQSMTARDASADSPAVIAAPWPVAPFVSSYEDVRGSKIHYVEYGTGDPILLVHGIPTSSLVWRNVIKPLSRHGRVIAVDLVGYGLSDKPNIQYRLTELQDYLSDFIRQLDLHRVTLVVHDLGGFVGLPVAAMNADRIQRIVAFETVFGPIEDARGLTKAQLGLLERTNPGNADPSIIGPGGKAFDLIVRKNAFLLSIAQPNRMPLATPEILASYRAPFVDPLSRWALYRPFQDIPFAGTPKESFARSQAALEYLQSSPVPKLYIQPTPGFVTQNPMGSSEIARTFANIDIVQFGPGGHYLQEENPDHLSKIIGDWIKAN